MTAALLLLALALIAANGFFVGAEFAVLAARRARLEPRLRSSRGARTALRAIEQLPLMISAASSASLASLGLGALAEPVVASLLTEPLAVHVPHELVHLLALAIALTLVSALHMLLGEMGAEEPRPDGTNGRDAARPTAAAVRADIPPDHHRPDRGGHRCVASAAHHTRERNRRSHRPRLGRGADR